MQNASNRHAGGFTLLEILVVMAIIIVLAGLVFRLSGVVSDKNSVAKTKKTIEQVANALEEFRAIYGTYPPVPMYPEDPPQPMRYEFALAKSPKYEDGLDANMVSALKNANVEWEDARLFTFGLMSFFIPRYTEYEYEYSDESNPKRKYNYIPDDLGGSEDVVNPPEQWKKFQKGKENLNNIRRIRGHLSGLTGLGFPEASLHEWNPGGFIYTTGSYTLRDDWGSELRYESFPPYSTYKIWSVGRDRKTGTPDDIVAGRE